MNTATANYVTESNSSKQVATSSATSRVFTVLRLTYGLVPIVAGLDKFTSLLTNWDQYLAPQLASMLPFEANTFMLLVGVTEIIAGIIVLLKPRLGSIIVCLWLLGIAINLLLTGQYFDIAVRDAVMAVGAFCLFTLSNRRD